MGLVPSSILEGPIIKSGQRCCSFSYDEKFAIRCAEYIVECKVAPDLLEVRMLSQLGIKDEKRRSMRSARRRQWRNAFVTIDGHKRSLWRGGQGCRESLLGGLEIDGRKNFRPGDFFH